MQKIQGGYVLVNRNSLMHLNAQISSRTISVDLARGMLGFLEMRSIRSGAGALKPKFKGAAKRNPNYSAKELQIITGLSHRTSTKVFAKATTREEPLDEKGKCIPIPRRLVRFMAKCEKRSTLLVLLTYIERGLSLDKGKIKNAGTAKASIIAKQTGLTIRSVRSARAELLKLGILTPDTTRYQRKLNRDGAYFTINLSWNQSKKAAQTINRKGSEGTLKDPGAEKVPVDSLRPSLQISPPTAQKSTQISPPYRNKNSSYEVIRNQKTHSRVMNSSGVCIANEKGRGGDEPNIFDVRIQDLNNFSRTRILYEQAIKANLIKESQANYLNFIAAAIRAKSLDNVDMVKVFVGIVRKGLWKNITLDQESRANNAIKRYEDR